MKFLLPSAPTSLLNSEATFSLTGNLKILPETPTEGKYLKLINWANSVSKSEYSVAEIKDYIQYLIAEYLDALRLHKLKYEISTFQTYFIFVAEFVENLLKLKLSDLAKMFIEVQKHKIEMLQEEKELPGNEIAYFVKAQMDLSPNYTLV